MSDINLIELSGKAAGLVARERTGVRFYASNEPFFALDGQYFRSLQQAERAVRRFAVVAAPPAARSGTARP
ncbi:hypothetical protein [Zavarzinia sp. CC-PAN008]|uniref:hypothetical protein n=1 Tax=Zavarzinia sp. CC-PAN008 TaxID=3243332 RepID=UPI003F74A774